MITPTSHRGAKEDVPLLRGRNSDAAHAAISDRPVRPSQGPREHRVPIVALPEPGIRLEQDAEWCLVKCDGAWRQIRFHDYGEIYRIPGLYEKIFYDILHCVSPTVIRRELAAQLDHAGVEASSLRVLDLGAGNGMMGEQLTDLGARTLVGVDILEEAAMAARRDRPGVYRDYFALDMLRLDPVSRESLRRRQFNCLTCVAALGFGDIPAAAFIEAVGLIGDGGWMAFNIKDEFVRDPSRSEFAAIIAGAAGRGELQILSQRRYVHRLSTSGRPLEYVAFVGRKRGDWSRRLDA